MIKYDEDDRKGEINIVVASRFMVTVKGRGVERKTLMQFAESVNFESLANN